MFNPAGVRGRDSEAALKFNLTDLLLERGREEERKRGREEERREKREEKVKEKRKKKNMKS